MSEMQKNFYVIAVEFSAGYSKWPVVLRQAILPEDSTALVHLPMGK
jgi:hypothetical protein